LLKLRYEKIRLHDWNTLRFAVNCDLRATIFFFFFTFFTLSHTPISLYLYRTIGEWRGRFDRKSSSILYTSLYETHSTPHITRTNRSGTSWYIFVSVSVWYESSHMQQYIDVYALNKHHDDDVSLYTAW